MNIPRLSKQSTIFASSIALALIAALGAILWFFLPTSGEERSLRFVSTIAGLNGEIGEPFGVAVKGDEIYFSDGQNGKIWKIQGEKINVFAEGLDTPSGLAFDSNGGLLVADSGSHNIVGLDRNGKPITVYGLKGMRGSVDGDTQTAGFNAPIGIAAAPDGRIFVADTYNDRIRLIENGRISTLAGGERGYADGIAGNAKFDTPAGIAFSEGRIYVADTGNRRIRVIEPNGSVQTIAGNGEGDLTDGTLLSASFVHPTGIAVDDLGTIFVTDGNAIRMITGAISHVSTISGAYRGLADGIRSKSKFNRPSGLSVTESGDLIIADSENRLVRRMSHRSDGHRVTAAEIAATRDKPDQFRNDSQSRWPFDPPTTKRDIAGTLGEIRGEMTPTGDDVWFHNGLDIAGAYGEIARFIRDEKVLRPIASENFGTLRELIRMPMLGYIHIRLGRNADGKPFGDERFQFRNDPSGKLTDVRVPRGTKFKAGEPIGTLNPMNHVHLVAGRSGSEMNALDALVLPGISDSRPPVIEKVSIYDQNWNPVETQSTNSRIRLTGNTRIVAKAYDQVDENAERRRLGVYKLGYQLLDAAKNPMGEINWTIQFDRMPSNEAVQFAYADKSHSGATGETIFNYIVTNFVDGDSFREGFLERDSMGTGDFTLKVFAADYFGNISTKEIDIAIGR